MYIQEILNAMTGEYTCVQKDAIYKNANGLIFRVIDDSLRRIIEFGQHTDNHSALMVIDNIEYLQEQLTHLKRIMYCFADDFTKELERRLPNDER